MESQKVECEILFNLRLFSSSSPPSLLACLLKTVDVVFLFRNFKFFIIVNEKRDMFFDFIFIPFKFVFSLFVAFSFCLFYKKIKISA